VARAVGVVMPTSLERIAMSSQDAKPRTARRLSRRSLLQGAATAGAAGLAVTAIGSAASPAFAATDRSAAAENHSDVTTHAGPIMVHVRNAKTGDIEVFSGTSKTRLRDKDLAARIARAIG
jgi:nitrous oxide reductase